MLTSRPASPLTRLLCRAVVANLLLAAPTPMIAQQARTDTTVRVAARPRHAGVATLVPEISIGEIDGAEEYLFGDVVEMAVARDGSIYVFDRQVPALRKYDARGKYVKTFGAKGQGPGEYVHGGGLTILPDGRVLLWDTGNWRINVYSANGDVLNSVPTPSGMGGNFTMVTSASLQSDTAGLIYLRRTIRPTRSSGGPMGPGRPVVVRLRANGTVVDTIDAPAFAREPRILTATRNVDGGVSSTSSPLPFDPAPVWTMSPLGHIVSGVPDRYAFELLGPRQPVLSIRRDVQPDPVTAAERQKARSDVEAGMRRLDPNWNWNGPEIPRFKPFYSRLIAADDGRIWVQRVAESGPRPGGISSTSVGGTVRTRPPTAARDEGPPRTGLYDVFDPNGTFVGQVQVPPRTSLMVRRGDHAWGLVFDEDDVVTVKRFRINWR
jgi:hypothetical protein